MKSKILILDDDSAVRTSLVKLLERAHYNVVQASSGAGAIDIFRASAVDLVVMDLNLKDDEGWSIFERMKVLNPFVPTVVISSESDERQKAVSAGAEALIEKPIDVEAFLGTIQILLAESREQRLARSYGDDHYCRHVAGYHAPLFRNLDERNSVPLKLSSSLSAALSIQFEPSDEDEAVEGFERAWNPMVRTTKPGNKHETKPDISSTSNN
jgi:DNA-binding response OmpR family regulator